jgi:flavodoxin
MMNLVMYDSAYGNTGKVAQAIADALGVTPKLMSTVTHEELQAADLIIIGSPTQGGNPTQAMMTWLKQLPKGILANKQVAAFDTRFEINGHGFWLKFVMKIIGFAAAKIAIQLRAKGGVLIAPPEGFIVNDKEGPLRQGEPTRAAAWARRLLG